ncbi:MAG: LacI family DNA-binding transcriptional regulator [Xanthomonadaceae bacterium]|nr:LacI family DNA-binding transcriptional regulator [Xanthomonadaceae bacterium]MDP2184933.1 LacI family DNA-binding transcriptional regulator [Xanthomonadales bacterium]MDZ4115933.1 LacI family DNA-binding transcriptional regulator [Xanthomonadaceae bacterium]MDZ4378157.1 LacI family DNA-binding transcriptional regulator [Xanthomonadaceae bacterium]
MTVKKSKRAKGEATIDQVADLAGVSIKTVSRVLNREPNVRAATQQRVLNAVKALDYLPNLSARGLAGRRSHMVGLVYNNPSPNYLFHVLSGLLEACRESGYGLAMHLCSPEEPDLVRSATDFARQSRVDGLILIPPVGDVPALLTALEDMGLPFVRLSPMDGRPGLGVAINERHAATRVVEYLLELGHRRIGFVMGDPMHGASMARYQGYCDGLERGGITLESELVADGRFTFESGRSAGEYFVGMSAMPTAIFASNDEMAAGVLQVAHERGVDIPQQLSIVGFDDTPVSREVWPAMTTVHQPISHMSKQATLMLLDAIKDNGAAAKVPKAQLHIFDAPLVKRDTTAAPSAGKRRAAAIRRA